MGWTYLPQTVWTFHKQTFTFIYRGLHVLSYRYCVRGWIALLRTIVFSSIRSSSNWRCHGSKTMLTSNDVISCICWTRLFLRLCSCRRQLCNETRRLYTVTQVAQSPTHSHLVVTSAPAKLNQLVGLYRMSHKKHRNIDRVCTVFGKKRPRYFQLQLSHFLVDFYNFCTIENRNEYFTIMCNLLT